MEELDHCLEAAHFLIIAVQQRLREIDDIHKKSIKSLIALMLYLMTKLDTVQSSQNTTEDLKHTRAGMKSNALEKISCLLKKSMQRELLRWVLDFYWLSEETVNRKRTWARIFTALVCISKYC